MIWPFGNTHQDRARFRILATLILVFIVVPVGFGVLAYTGQTLNWNWHPIYLMIGAYLLVASAFIFLAHRHEDSWNQFRQEFLFVFWHGRYAWIIGSGAALFLVTVYLLLPTSGTNIYLERVASSIGIYIGTLAAVLGIHTLYLKTSPITDVTMLLERLVSDLKEYSRPGHHLLICYPALSIGYYRAIKLAGTANLPEHHPYRRFRDATINAAYALRNTARIITYHINYYHKLYDAYDKAKKNPQEARVTACVEDATSFAQAFKAQAGNTAHTELHPTQLPSHVIVVGPVCYLISSYGLPKWSQADDDFHWSEPHEATLLVYRREDPALAELILREVNDELAELEGDAPKNGGSAAGNKA